MGDSGSDTETDDEMLKRRQAPPTHRAIAPTRGAVVHGKSAFSGRVEAPQSADEVAAVKTSDYAVPSMNDTNPPSGDASPRKRAGFLSLILNIDDDEPPQFPSESKPEAPAARHDAISPSPNPEAPRMILTASIATPVPGSVTITAPAEDQFVSPFASLALLSARPPAPPPAPSPILAPVPVPATVPARAPAPACAAPASADVHALPLPPLASRAAPVPSPAPTTPSPSAEDTAIASGATRSCALCHEPLQFTPARVGLQCNCCMLTMPLHAFSKNQRRPDHPCRRCSSCTQAREMPAKFKNIHAANKVNPNDPNDPRLTARQRARLLPATRSAPLVTAPDSVSCTPEEWHEMEVEVRNLKLAKRSILRRRTGNDLRGCTRTDYIAHLDAEEKRVDAKMAKARARNPALYEELTQSIKVIRARIAPGDRDSAATKTKHKKATLPAKTKRKNKVGTDDEAMASSPAAKRARASPTSAKKTKAVSATTTKKEAAPTTVVSSENDSEDAAPRRQIATRARTRQAAKPVVVIDLIDSDSH